MERKKRVLLNAANLTPDMREALERKYPYGVEEAVRQLRSADGKRRLAVVLDTPETTFLVWFRPSQLNGSLADESSESDAEDWGEDVPDNVNDYPET